MSEQEIKFCTQFEGKVKELQLLNIIKDNLTEKGREALSKTQKWVTENLDLYLSITGK